MPKKTPKSLTELIMEGLALSAQVAVQEALRYNTLLVVWQNGKAVEVSPESLAKKSSRKRKKK